MIGPSAQGPRMSKISPQANGWKSTFSKCHLNTHNQLCSLRRTQVWQLFQGDTIDWDQGDRAKRARPTHVENWVPGQWMEVNMSTFSKLHKHDTTQTSSFCFETDASTRHELLHFFVETDASTKQEFLHFSLKRTQVQNMNFFIFC